MLPNNSVGSLFAPHPCPFLCVAKGNPRTMKAAHDAQVVGRTSGHAAAPTMRKKVNPGRGIRALFWREGGRAARYTMPAGPCAKFVWTGVNWAFTAASIETASKLTMILGVLCDNTLGKLQGELARVRIDPFLTLEREISAQCAAFCPPPPPSPFGL